MSFDFGFPEFPPPMTASPAQPYPIPAHFQEDTSADEDELIEQPDDWTEKLLKKTYVHNAIFEAREVASFEVFGLPENVLRGLYSEMRFDRPSEIQALSLPLICKPPFHSIVAQAQNGSGKTCCFVLCILTRMDYTIRAPQALIVVPTRELAIQNEDVVRKMGAHTSVTVISSRSNEIDRLRRPITEMVVVSTMGTLMRWKFRGWISYKHIKVLVFDEADIMLNQDDFKNESIMLMLQLHQEANSPQVLLFSATYNEKIKQHAQVMFSTFPPAHDVQKIYLPREELSLDTIAQVIVKVDGYYDKIRVVTERILEFCTNGKTIIFVRTRSSAATLHRVLGRVGWSVTAISGEMEFTDRDRVIDEFRRSVTSILVSTDVLARGFDVFDVNVVINFDIPRVYETGEPAYETYLHRVGRSGRFRRHGVAFNLVDADQNEGDDLRVMEAIAKHFDREIPELDANSDEELNAFLQKAGIPGT